MGYDWSISQAESLASSRIQEFFIFFLIIAILSLVLLLPTFIAFFRDLSFLQILEVFFATFLGFWVTGFILSFLLKKEKTLPTKYTNKT